MRKLFGKIHLWLSIPVGIILSIICFSGAALVFEKEITQACKPHLYKVSVPEGNAAALPPSQLDCTHKGADRRFTQANLTAIFGKSR